MAPIAGAAVDSVNVSRVTPGQIRVLTVDEHQPVHESLAAIVNGDARIVRPWEAL